MRKISLFLLFSIFFVSQHNTYAQLFKSRRIIELKILTEEKVNLALQQDFRIGVKSKHLNGKEKYTKGFLNGTISWNRYNVKVDNANFYKGIVYFNRKNFNKNNNKIKINIQDKRKPNVSCETEITIPYVTEIELKYDTGAVLSPGYAIPLSIVAKYSNKTKVAVAFNNDWLNWGDFTYQSSAGTFDENKFIISPSAKKIYSHILIKATYKHDETLFDTTYIPINYKCPYVLNYNGNNGMGGYFGSNAYGNNNRDGIRGGNGGNGERGGNGPKLKCYILSHISNEDTLLRVLVLNKNVVLESFVYNPKGGSMSILANGGRGGNGGNGGSGSDALSEDKVNGLSSGNGGDGGNGGNGGDGGDGGTIEVFTDSIGVKFLNTITLYNDGGPAGRGGLGGERGRGGYKESKSLWTLLGNIVNIRAGSSGINGNSGISGEKGEEPQINIWKTEKLVNFFLEKGS